MMVLTERLHIELIYIVGWIVKVETKNIYCCFFHVTQSNGGYKAAICFTLVNQYKNK